MNSLVTMVKYPLIHFLKSDSSKKKRRKQIHAHIHTRSYSNGTNSRHCTIAHTAYRLPSPTAINSSNNSNILLANKQIDIKPRSIRNIKKKSASCRKVSCLCFGSARSRYTEFHIQNKEIQSRWQTHSILFLCARCFSSHSFDDDLKQKERK